MNNSERALRDIFFSALEAVDPYQAVTRHIESIGDFYEKGRFQKLMVFGFGKAVSPMLRALMERMGDRVNGGAAITKYGYGSTQPEQWSVPVFEAGHPLPDQAGLKATEELMGQVKGFDTHTLGVCLISGGGSALLVAPYPGISLEEKIRTTDLLLKAGADIDALNTVRKHLSSVKGGRLAEMAYPGTLRSLILSDVIGDKLDVIASGPTAPDRSTYQEALAVLRRYVPEEKFPASVLKVLSRGAAGQIAETPKHGSPIFQRVENRIIGSNQTALEAAGNRASRLGYETTVLSNEIQGEAREAGRRLAARALEFKRARGSGRSGKVCLLSGGETTVTVKGAGKGGRNMELALAFAMEIDRIAGITLLSAGTDGTDGPTEAAGALVDGRTLARAREAGLEGANFLAANDSYHFFAQTGELFITGPTNTNVMDLQIVLIES